MRPSEYFERQCFAGAEADEDIAEDVFRRLGNDCIVFSTDFPHGDSQYPHAVETFRKLPLSEETQRKITGDNWSRLYDIPLERKRAR